MVLGISISFIVDVASYNMEFKLNDFIKMWVKSKVFTENCIKAPLKQFIKDPNEMVQWKWQFKEQKNVVDTTFTRKY